MKRQKVTVVVATGIRVNEAEVRDAFEKLSVTVESVEIERLRDE